MNLNLTKNAFYGVLVAILLVYTYILWLYALFSQSLPSAIDLINHIDAYASLSTIFPVHSRLPKLRCVNVKPTLLNLFII